MLTSSIEAQAVLAKHPRIKFALDRRRQDPFRNYRKCKECRLFLNPNLHNPFVLRRGSSTPKIVFVGEAPGREEDERGRPFIGDSGDTLDNAIKAVGLPYDKLAWTNVVICRPPANKLERHPMALPSCKEGVLHEIQALDPDIVVPLGGTALKILTGFDGIQEHRGRVLTSNDIRRPSVPDLRERTYIATWHPAYVNRVKDEGIVFLKDLEKVADLYNGTFDPLANKPPSRVITSYVEAKAYLKRALESQFVTFDYECTGLDPYLPSARLLSVGMCIMYPDPGVAAGLCPWKPDAYGASIPLYHKDTPFTVEEVKDLIHDLRKILINSKIIKLAHNAKFEATWSKLHTGIMPRGLLLDTMLLHYVVDERKGSHKLKVLVDKFTPYEGYARPLEKLLEENGGDWDALELFALCDYNGCDAYVTAALFAVLWPMVYRENQWGVVDGILNPTTPFLAKMELNGINVDKKRALQLDDRFGQRAEDLDREMRSLPQVKEAENLLAARAHKKLELQKSIDAVSLQDEKYTAVKKEREALQEPPEGAPQKDLNKYERAVRRLNKSLEDRHRILLNTQEGLTNKRLKLTEESRMDFGSNTHLKTLYFDVLKLEPVKYTPKNKPSLDKEALEIYARRNPIAARQAEYRTMLKMRSTYLRPILSGLVLKPDGYVHPHVMPLTETGRLSSGQKDVGKSGESQDTFKYNIQNIPRPWQQPCARHWPKARITCKECEWISIRNIFQTRFICSDHHPQARGDCPKCGSIVAADYAQLEFMLMGILAQDPKVLQCIQVQTECEERYQKLSKWTGLSVDKDHLDAIIYNESFSQNIRTYAEHTRHLAYRADIHRISASMAYNCEPEEITKQQRQDIKSAISFGLVYGRGAKALAEDMGWSVKEAQKFIDNFFRGYYRIRLYLNRTREFALRYGYVLSPLGRKRRLPDLFSRDKALRARAINQSLNFAIQSVASDFNLLAAIELQSWLEAEKARSKIIALVHDAIYVDCPPEEAKIVSIKTKEIMETVPMQQKYSSFMIAPLRAEVKLGATMDG